MKILLVHGVGHSETDPDYYQPWMEDITTGLRRAGLTEAPEYVGFHYDKYFEENYQGPGIYAAALAELIATTAWHWVADPIGNIFHPSREFINPYGDNDFRWKAGMVAQLAVEDALRQKLREVLRQTLSETKFDVVAAHSLGTLITYDFFRNDAQGARLLGDGTYLTFGSQINNDFARNRLFSGPLRMPEVRAWYHLYNEHDPVFTAPIRLSDPRFRQVNTPSESGHSPVATPAGPGYLDHPRTQSEVWNSLATQTLSRGVVRTRGGTRVIPAALELETGIVSKPERRALIIGINDYPDPANRLEGCVNDAFLMSEVLQERGYQPENIRLLLNERATADAIRERLAWLLYRADDGMERTLFFSGHGAQMPGYNAFEEVDHVNECLVPYDFAWTEQSAITDKDIYRLYSDLPFGTRFFAMFDCCHSGGLTRSGSHKARSIDPPDDIRHRLMRWDPERGIWLERSLPSFNKAFGGTADDRRAYMGSNGATYKVGRAMRLRRSLSEAHYESLEPEARGPFLPVLMEACGEGELAYEYRHGVTSYGAFTYSMVNILRRAPKDLTFRELVAHANEMLRYLGYRNQTAQLIGPDLVVDAPVPGGRAFIPPATTATAAETATAARREEPSPTAADET